MNVEPIVEKAEWRRRFRDGLKLLTPAQREEQSARARDLLRRQTAWQGARTVLFYAPIGGELDLTPLLEEAARAGKISALPGFVSAEQTYQAFAVADLKRDCAPGKFGIPEPAAHCPRVSLKQLDLALVPGLGFDVSGRRLGRGRGFYDRLLAGIAGARCGVALDQQVVGRIPAEQHDMTMNFILTPTRWLETAEGKAVES